jgi:hypothetical protein
LIRLPDAALDRSPDEILRDIERRRESIARTVEQAGQRVEESLDWREKVRAHPYGSVALVAGTAFLAARLLRRGETPVDRLTTTLSDNVEQVGNSLRRSIDTLGRPRAGIGRTLATTLAAIAMRSIVHSLRKAVVENQNAEPTEGEPHDT